MQAPRIKVTTEWKEERGGEGGRQEGRAGGGAGGWGRENERDCGKRMNLHSSIEISNQGRTKMK